MSRVGKKPIKIPAGVEVTLSSGEVTVKGPKGVLTSRLNSRVEAKIVDADGGKELVVQVVGEKDLDASAQWGTARAILANMITGVTEGFKKILEVNGVGYRVSVSGKKLVLNLGFSHEVPFTLPDGIAAVAEGNMLTITGIDAQAVGEFAARVRRMRKPEPYKGKGIKYSDEVVKRKAGKAAKTSEK